MMSRGGHRLKKQNSCCGEKKSFQREMVIAKRVLELFTIDLLKNLYFASGPLRKGLKYIESKFFKS